VIAAYASSHREATIPFQAMMVRGLEIDGVYVYTMKPAERARALADLDRLIRAGGLEHRIARRFALGETAAAHELQESGQAVGNIIIDIDPL
jgi:NADPH2:quinone reductase